MPASGTQLDCACERRVHPQPAYLEDVERLRKTPECHGRTVCPKSGSRGLSLADECATSNNVCLALLRVCKMCKGSWPALVRQAYDVVLQEVVKPEPTSSLPPDHMRCVGITDMKSRHQAP